MCGLFKPLKTFVPKITFSSIRLDVHPLQLCRLSTHFKHSHDVKKTTFRTQQNDSVAHIIQLKRSRSDRKSRPFAQGALAHRHGEVNGYKITFRSESSAAEKEKWKLSY